MQCSAKCLSDLPLQGCTPIHIRELRCSITHVQSRSFHWSINAIFGKVGRLASEKVTLQLVKSKYIPVLTYGQGLKYNFQGGGTVQLCGPPSWFPGPSFISWAHVSIAGSQIINDRLNVLSMIFILFFFLQFC